MRGLGKEEVVKVGEHIGMERGTYILENGLIISDMALVPIFLTFQFGRKTNIRNFG
jgi:hypothetical protein